MMEKIFVIRMVGGEFYSNKAYTQGFCEKEWQNDIVYADKFEKESQAESEVKVKILLKKNSSASVDYLKIESYYCKC